MAFFLDNILDIPCTPINMIWLGFSLFQVFGYIVIYHTSAERLTSLLQALAALGKTRTVPRRFDMPKSLFIHYYVIATCWNAFVLWKLVSDDTESAAMSIFQISSAGGRSGDRLSLIMAVGLLLIHVSRRLYECLFVSVFSPGGAMSPAIYAWGCLYYVILTVTLFAESLPLGGLEWGELWTARKALGVAVYLAGVWIQHDSIKILASLRRNKDKSADSHMLPFGGFFAYVSNPHYLGELVIYCGIWLVIGQQSKSFALVMFYLVITHMHLGKSSHLWYQKTFSNMPKERKALVPFVW